MNSLCQLERGAHIRYSVTLVVCAKVGGSGAIPPKLSNSTSPKVLIDTVKGVTINIVTSPVYDRANVNARFKSQIWVMHRKLRVVAVIWQFRIQGAPDRESGWTAPWWAVQLSKSHPGPRRPFGVGPRTAVPNHDLAGQEKGSRVLWTNSMVVTVNGGQKIVENQWTGHRNGVCYCLAIAGSCHVVQLGQCARDDAQVAASWKVD